MSRWIWQHSVEDAFYTNWAPSYPSNNNSGNDCVVMESRDNFEWSDVDCGGVQASPVCQRYTNERTTTTDEAPTTTSQCKFRGKFQFNCIIYPLDYVELRGGDNSSSGNVFAVNSNGFFGPVCGDSWGFYDADVVCRQLGFSNGIPHVDSFYGNVPEIFAMDNVGCSGSEYHIQDCTYSTSDDCGPNEGAGVNCY